MMNSIDPRTLAALAGAAQQLSALVLALSGTTPVTPVVTSGMPEQLAKSWEAYPGKGVAVEQRDGRWIDCRGAFAKAPAKARRVKSPPAPVAPAAAPASRVELVAQREREQIAEARRIEQLYRSGQLSQAQAIELAYHEIGKKRARAMMS